MGDLKTSIILDLAGNLQSRARAFTGSLQQLGRKGHSSMQMLGRGISTASRGLDRMGNRYTALLTGAAGVGAARMVGNLEERFVRLGIQANAGADEIDALKKEIFEIAKAPEIRVDPGEITSAIEEIIEKTGDLKFARENIRSIGMAIKATGAEGQSIGGIMAEFQKMGLGAKQAFEALDILTVQGKEGAFTLQNLAALGPRVVTAYTAMGRTGVPAIREMGAALQVIRQGTGSSEMAASAFEALIRTLSDADKVKLLRKGGIKIFEPGSKTQMRSIVSIMEDLIRKTKGSKLLLSKYFDAEAIRAFNAAAGEFQRTGKVESLQKFFNVQADGSAITHDSIRAAKTFNAALTSLYTVWKHFTDKQLTEPVKKLTEYLDSLKPDTVERWLNIAKYIAMIGGGLIVANKVGQGVAGAFKMGKGIFGKGGGVAAGALGGSMTPIPVYVVNAPDALGAGKTVSGKEAIKKGSVLAAGGMIVAPAAVAAIVAGLSAEVGKRVGKWQLDVGKRTTSELEDMLNRQAVMGGGAQSYQSKLIQGELDRRIEGAITIGIEDDRIRVKEMRSNNPGLDYEVDSGRTMRGPG